jgi:hypothetical protein
MGREMAATVAIIPTVTRSSTVVNPRFLLRKPLLRTVLMINPLVLLLIP